MFAGKRWSAGLLIKDFEQLNFEQAAKWLLFLVHET
jgi:hypothetical protein